MVTTWIFERTKLFYIVLYNKAVFSVTSVLVFETVLVLFLSRKYCSITNTGDSKAITQNIDRAKASEAIPQNE